MGAAQICCDEFKKLATWKWNTRRMAESQRPCREMLLEF